MNGSGITRLYGPKKATILSGAAKSDGIDIRHAAGGLVRTPAAWTAADIGFEVAAYDATASGEGTEQNRPDNAYAALLDKTGSRVKITNVVAGKWFEIPSQVFQAGFVKIASINTGTGADENQGADRAMVVALKS